MSACTELALQPISVSPDDTNGKGSGKIVPRGSKTISQFTGDLKLATR